MEEIERMKKALTYILDIGTSAPSDSLRDIMNEAFSENKVALLVGEDWEVVNKEVIMDSMKERVERNDKRAKKIAGLPEHLQPYDIKCYIYVDTIEGVPGTEVGLNGIQENPVNNYGDAEALSKKLEPVCSSVEIVDKTNKESNMKDDKRVKKVTVKGLQEEIDKRDKLLIAARDTLQDTLSEVDDLHEAYAKDKEAVDVTLKATEADVYFYSTSLVEAQESLLKQAVTIGQLQDNNVDISNILLEEREEAHDNIVAREEIIVELKKHIIRQDATLDDYRGEVEQYRAEENACLNDMCAPASDEEKAPPRHAPIYRVVTNGKRYAPEVSNDNGETWIYLDEWKRASHGRIIAIVYRRTYREALKFLRKQYGESADILLREWRAV